MTLFDSSAGAVFSDCRRYRYRLWRTWDDQRPALCFIGLNPSVADETVLDPTLTRLVERAKAWNYGALQVANVYALVSTDPRGLWREQYPVGELGETRTNLEILQAVRASERVLCGWGRHAGKRGQEVMEKLRKWGVTPFALKLNSDGSPTHPLYIGYSATPFQI